MPASNLTPQQLLRLQQMMNPGGSGWSPEMGGFTQDGTAYQTINGSMGGEGNVGQPQAFEGAISYDPNKTQPGDKFSAFDRSGQFTNESQFKDMSGFDPLLGMFLASALGMGAFLPGGFASGSAAGGAGGAAGGGGLGGGVSGAAFGDAGMMYAGADAAAAGTLGGGASLSSVAPLAAGAGGGAAGGLLTNSPIPQVTAGEFLGTTMIPEFTAGSGLLSTALKYGLPLAGALAGAKGSDAEQTQTRKQDPRLDSYVFGDDTRNGLLNMVYDQLQRNASPEGMEATNRMRAAGQGLLGTPQRGNGFNRFFPGR